MKPLLTDYAVKIAAIFWSAIGPMHVIGALISKMSTFDRYITQLTVVAVMCVIAFAAVIGVVLRKSWSRWLLIGITWPTSIFWLASGIAINDVPAILFGLIFVFIAVALQLSESPSKETLDAR